jgi:2-alkyl-3-oxoalkanoate reductase
MQIVVTGAAGFVGGAFLRRFADRRDFVLHGVARQAVALPNFVRVELSDPFELALRPDVVIHAAGRTSPWGTAREYARDNVDATRNVITFCERHGHPRLILLSSSSVFYRDGEQRDITEASPIAAPFVSRYTASKHAAEALVRAYAGEHVIVRPTAVIGPGDRMLMPRLLAAAAKRRLPVIISDDGPVMTDLICIDALCDYVLTLATQRDVQPAYNLTNGEPVDVHNLLRNVLSRVGLPMPTRRLRARTLLRVAGALEQIHTLLPLLGEPAVTRFGASLLVFSKTFDISRARRDLGPPSISLDEGIDRYVAHLRAVPATA